jgi:chemotaxis protein MotB
VAEEQVLKIPGDQYDRLKAEWIREMQRNLENESEKIKRSLQEEIDRGLVSVETENLRIVIRIHEKGSFPSGSAVLDAGFSPAMDKITAAVRDSSANVVIAGHTDDLPIHNDWYRSNWELSSARSVTVAHEILRDKSIDPQRLVIEGHAETKPLMPNNSPENRAKNRRVEIILIQPDPFESRLSAKGLRVGEER